MSFVWTENITPTADILASNVNEVQDNIDTIYTALGITRTGCVSGAGWTEFPIAGGLVTDKLSAQPQQLRDATDYAYENKCPAYDNGYKDGVDTTEDTGYNNGDLVGVDVTYHPGYYSNEHGTYKSGVDTGYDSTYNPGYCNDQHTGVNSSVNSGYDSAYNPGVYRVG